MDQAEQLRKKIKKLYTPKAKTVAVISGKGGVGKSNIVLNFSINLAKRNKRVLLIDSDIGMANIDILLGESSSYTMVDILEKKWPIQQALKKGPFGLCYLSGGTTLSNIVQLREDSFQHFLKELEKMVATFDEILFDMGAGISKESMRFLMAVDEIIVVTTPEPTSIMDAYAAIKLVHQYDSDKTIKLVVNRCQKRTDGHQAWERLKMTTKQFLDLDIHLLGYIPEDKHVQQSVMNQTPIVMQFPTSPVAKALEAMTKEYLNVPNDHKGFIQRLKNLFSKG
ncbi:MinD/ParA family protein [Aeribacillus alveayuensis]|uniref:Flagellar biosynthesis protein FlhG n=1 Tax=Aeribacillus alveayuensis TaxID=279215 RepID=A0ABT9VLA4_9BACI|nr:flagellar biosynthesis protein FlhG [Bacillus alveayuensis]